MSSSQPTVAKDSLLKPAQQDTGLSRAIELLQDKVANLYPMARLKEAMVTEAQWFQFVNEMEERDWKQLNSLRFNYLADKYLKPEQIDLFKISRRNPARSSRPPSVQQQAKSTPRPRFRRLTVIDKENNPLIANTRDLTSPQKRQLADTGCRVTPMSTPKRREGKRYTSSTPGGTEKKFFSNIGGKSFWQNITPNKHVLHKPRVKHRDKYLCTQKKQVTFTVTLEKIQKRIGKRKSAPSQQSLTKASAQEIFNYHGLDFTLLKGAKHLEHIIGFVLGGEHDHTNIFAGTAVSNYQIRDFIEMYIVHMLEEGRTDEVHLDVEIGYENEYIDIPLVLNYTIRWQEERNGKKLDREETIAIYPRSTTRLDKAAKHTLEVARALSLETTDKSSSDEPLPLIESFNSLTL